jgi:hypothetical protein
MGVGPLRRPFLLGHCHMCPSYSVIEVSDENTTDMTRGVVVMLKRDIVPPSRTSRDRGRGRHPMSALVAIVSLLLTVALLPVPGGVIFAPFTFGLFLLSLVGVLSGLDDRRVRQRNPRVDPTRWRGNS